MKITLLQVLSDKKEYINKDVMGGYGEVCKIGNGFFAKILERMKKKGIKLPIFVFGYLAAILDKKGHDVNFITNKIPLESDLVIINSSIVDYKNELRYAEEIKERTKAKVGFIGPFATAKPELFMKVADFVICGEPESVFEKMTKIPKGIVKSTPVKDLDKLPYPKWDIFPYESYSYYPVIKGKNFIPVLSSRGCTFNCNYCPYKAYYKHWRTRSVDNIVNEIKYLVSNFKIKGILFRDPLFTVNRKKIMELAKAIINSGLKVEWACETHFEYLDKEMLNLLYKSGLRSINVGIESVDENVLKKATRINASRSHQDEMIKYCDKIGVKVSAFYIFGLEGDTRESILKTIKYAKKMNTHIAQFFICTPFPGTEYFEQVKNNLLTEDWERFDSFTPVIKHNNLGSSELLRLKEKAFTSYYFRPYYILNYIKRMFLR